MFVYTVYPTPGARRKRMSRRVEPVSRVNPVHPVERSRAATDNGFFVPGQIQATHGTADSQNPAYNQYIKKDGAQAAREESGGEWPENDLFIQNVLPILLAWRYPKPKVSPDYIQIYLDRLHTIQLKRDRLKT